MKKKKLKIFQPIFKITKNRSLDITSELLSNDFHVYTGKYFMRVTPQRTTLGNKLGEFIFTKKIGAIIHKSERNKKRQEKLQKKQGKKK